MKLPLLIAATLTLAACSEETPHRPSSQADEFAARINGDGASVQDAPVQQNPASDQAAQQPYKPAPPTIAPPREDIAPRENSAGKTAALGPFAPGTATDPASTTCGANKMGPFMGRLADDATRANVVSAAAGAVDVRFIDAGSTYVRADAANPRLNIMLDVQGIIRGARCG